jgi:hypothetical protein
MEQIAPESEAAGPSSAVDSLRGLCLEHPERLGDYRVLREMIATETKVISCCPNFACPQRTTR